jgi:hypothetical protein
MLKSCGERGVGVASLAITGTKRRLSEQGFLRAGGSLTEGVPHGLFVEGMGIESAFA